MKLKRVDDGEYHISHGGKTLQILRGTDRTWTVSAYEGIELEDKEADSYQAAKKTAEKILLSSAKLASKVTEPAAPSRTDALSTISSIRRQLDELERGLSKK